MPIQRGGLQVQEEEEQSASSLLKPHVLTVQPREARAPADTLAEPVAVHAKGRRQRGCFRGSVTVPNLAFRLAASTPLNWSVQLFFFLFFFPTLRKWLQKYWSGKVILFYFFVLFPPLFPFNQKEIPSWKPSPPFMQNWKWQYLIIAIMI